MHYTSALLGLPFHTAEQRFHEFTIKLLLALKSSTAIDTTEDRSVLQWPKPRTSRWQEDDLCLHVPLTSVSHSLAPACTCLHLISTGTCYNARLEHPNYYWHLLPQTLKEVFPLCRILTATLYMKKITSNEIRGKNASVEAGI